MPATKGISRNTLEEPGQHLHSGYTRPHACGYCGRAGVAHQDTRPTATLFCDKQCAQLYKRDHERSPAYVRGSLYDRLIKSTNKKHRPPLLRADLEPVIERLFRPRNDSSPASAPSRLSRVVH